MKKRGGKTFHLLWILFLTSGFFILPKIVLADENLVISEVLINGTGEEEFVELYNPTLNTIDLTGYYFAYYSSGRDWSDPYSKSNKFPDEAFIESKKFFLIKAKGGLPNSVDSDWSIAYNLSNSNGSIAIFPNNTFSENNVIDFVAWGNVEHVGKGQELKVPKSGNSLERISGAFNKWQESCVINGTPGKENSICKENNDSNSNDKGAPDYSGKVKINEIYPAPNTKEGENEFVEIRNLSNENIDFSKWCLKDKIEYDKADKGNCKKISEIKKAGDFYVLHGTFSLNNDSKGDSIFLYDSNNNLIDNQSYQSTKSEYSYAYDAESFAWRWTSKKTPGAKNEFDKILSGKIKKDELVYAGMYASFEVKADSDAQKFTWDFGDNHKSYLKKTTHKYEKTGEYGASLKISGNGEASQYFFTVKVEKYKGPKIKIVGVKANPKGKDTNLETIKIKNNSKKKVNLQKWSVATGWKELYNHPINKKFVLKPGETKELTRKYSAFTLNNKQTKIELRQPDGVVASKVKYSKKEGVKDDETYEKTESGWQWNNTEANADETKDDADETQANTDEVPVNAEEMQTDTENIQNNTEENAVIEETQTDDIEENPQVLGAEIVKDSANIETLNIKSDNINFEKQRFLSNLIWRLNQKINSAIGLVMDFF